MRRIRGWHLGLASALAVIAATPAAASEPNPDFDWHGHGGCTVPVIGMPTAFSNVAPYIADDQESRVINVGAGDVRLAGLLFVFIGCPTNLLDTSRGDYSSDNVTQVLAGVLYESGREEDLDKVQFYLLSSAIDWSPFVVSETFLGLPSDYVPDMHLGVIRDPVTGLGSFSATVPGGRAPFSASGQILAPNPERNFAQDAVHFYESPLGLIRVHHDESWAAGNGAVGTISAAPGSTVAHWMGAVSAQAEGVYVWIHDTLHVHHYQVVAQP